MVLSRAVRTSIEINAPAEKVWSVLMDWKKFPEWNPFVKLAEGEPKQGGRIKIVVQPPGKGAMSFQPLLLKVDPNKELRWEGKLMSVPGLFTGQHYYIIEELGPGKVRFVHGEDFFGVLVPLMGGSFPAVEQGFADMNAKLKELAEKQ